MASSTSLIPSNMTVSERYMTHVIEYLQPRLGSRPRITARSAITTAAAVVLTLWYFKHMIKLSARSTDEPGRHGRCDKTASGVIRKHLKPLVDATVKDPDLLRCHSEFKSFTASRFTYPRLRVFFKPHAKLDEMPTVPAPLPLLVFIHGLGGSIAQFHPLLTSLTHNSSCLAVDLPGCGASKFAPTSWEAYTTEALVELLEVIVDTYRERNSGQGIVLIGHSMGCALSARLACPGSTKLADSVVGLVAICPPSGPPTEAQVKTFRKLLWIPSPVFDLWRAWDARGGLESASVQRFVGVEADMESKQSQHRFNRQSRTPVWRRMAWGSLPRYENGVPKGGIADREIWASLNVPVYLIGGGKDRITPPDQIDKILEFMRSRPRTSCCSQLGTGNSHLIMDAAASIDANIETSRTAERIEQVGDEEFCQSTGSPTNDDDPSTPDESNAVQGMPAQPVHPHAITKSIVLPRGTHAMIYTQDCSHILASIIADFLSQHVTGRLSRSWQLQYLNKESKWDVKNLAKWKSVEPISKPIAGILRAMKTMREVDDEHSPAKFVQTWGKIVKDVVDISKDTPVYDPAGLERAGVRYHKFPTVSKIPPTDDEVDGFIVLVDRLREKQKKRAVEEGWDESAGHAVGVHCHYGFNRTGYFIVCYLVERCGFEVQQAIDTFAEARPKGIRHSHFKDQLFVRYSELRSKEPR